MGRGRLAMKLIEKEKSQKAMFHKRKNGIMKKVHELSTLCGVDICVILYSPNSTIDQLETLPQDLSDVHWIIGKYEASIVEKRPKNYGMLEFFKDRKNKVGADCSKLHKERLNMLYPTWDKRSDMLGEEELRMIVRVLDAKIEDCRQRINMLKKKHYLKEKQLELKVASNRSHLCFLQNTSTSQTVDFSRSQKMMLSFDPNLMHLMVTQNDDDNNNGNNGATNIGAFGYDPRDGRVGNYSSDSSSPCNYYSKCYASLQKSPSQNNVLMQYHHHEANLQGLIPLLMMQGFQTN